jgi:hypothetical protein
MFYFQIQIVFERVVAPRLINVNPVPTMSAVSNKTANTSTWVNAALGFGGAAYDNSRCTSDSNNGRYWWCGMGRCSIGRWRSSKWMDRWKFWV